MEYICTVVTTFIIILSLILYSYKCNIISFRFNNKTYTTIKYKVTRKSFMKSLISALGIGLLVKTLIVYDTYYLFSGVMILVISFIDNRHVIAEFIDGDFIKSKLINFANSKNEGLGSGSKQPLDDKVGSNKGKDISGSAANTSISYKKPVNFSVLTSEDLEKHCPGYFEHLEHAFQKNLEFNNEQEKITKDFYDKYQEYLTYTSREEVVKLLEEKLKIVKRTELAINVYSGYDFYDKTKFENFQRDTILKNITTDLDLKIVDMMHKDLDKNIKDTGLNKKLLDASYNNTRDNLTTIDRNEKRYKKSDYKVRLNMFDNLIKNINKEK